MTTLQVLEKLLNELSKQAWDDVSRETRALVLDKLYPTHLRHDLGKSIDLHC